MGAAPETVQKAELTPEEAQESERQWFLDARTGELKPDGGHSDQGPGSQGPESGSKAVRVARWLLD